MNKTPRRFTAVIPLLVSDRYNSAAAATTEIFALSMAGVDCYTQGLQAIKFP